MFTEGLDEAAISWVKGGGDSDQKPRSPIATDLQSLCKNNIHRPSSIVPLPPLKFIPGVLGSIPSLSADLNDDEESIASALSVVNLSYSDSIEEECPLSSDEEVKSYVKPSLLVRSHALETLKIEIPSTTAANYAINHESRVRESTGDLASAPSAPPIFEIGRENSSVCEDEHEDEYEKDEGDAIEMKDTAPEKVSSEMKPQIEDHGDELINYHSSSQNAWQTFVAYDACFRLCLNAWSRGCMEAPHFLQDECSLLRNAFGLQRFLLQPRGHNLRNGNSLDSPKESSGVKEKKTIEKIKIEVRKIRLLPLRKFQGEYSPRALLMKSGADYVKQASALLRTQINTLKAMPSPSAQEDSLFCLLSLRRSTESSEDEAPAACLQPGSGDSHVLYPESLGDAIVIEVQNSSKASQGRAIIPVSSLSENPGDKAQWWPIQRGDNDCVGKIKLSVTCLSTYAGTGNLKGGNVGETVVFDSVLEAAMRAQRIGPRNLKLEGSWKWLLNEFADYYGVSDAYAKLRYVSYIMNLATPTKDCLELLHDLLLPVVKARHANSLSRQEKNLFLECESQVDKLLASTFTNYKSLDDQTPSGLVESSHRLSETAPSALAPAVQLYVLLHDILSQEGQTRLRKYLQAAAADRCRRRMMEADEFVLVNNEGLTSDPVTISTAYHKMKGLCLSIRSEIDADIKIHNQHILPSSIDLPSISASLYSSELCKRLRAFLAACPPFGPAAHVTDLLSASADFERDLQAWAIPNGVVSRELFHDYIMVWIEETRLRLVEQCRGERVAWSGALTNYSTSPFVESMYDQIRGALVEYEAVINRWPHYLLHLEAAVADVERTIMKTLEKQCAEILAPLRDGFPKLLEKHVQKLTGRQSNPIYQVPDQLGSFLNTVKRMLDTLHVKVEHQLRSWEPALTVAIDGKSTFGEQMNGVTVLLRKKFKNYVEAIVEKLIANAKVARATRLKRVLEETRETDGEAEVRERMQPLRLQLADSMRNLHGCLSGRIFVTVCRGLWDRMGQVVLGFLESRKENRVWYRASDHALSVLEDLFASQMQMLLGNSLQEKDLEPPRSVVEARSILR
ncbi:portal protein [Wolffia australiana]